MNTFVHFFVLSILVTIVASYPGIRYRRADNSIAGASSGSGTSTGFPQTNNYDMLSGYFQALYNYHQLLLANLNTHPLGVGGFTYAGGFPGYQPFPTFQPNFPAYTPPRFSPVFPAGGFAAGATANIGNGMAHQTAFLNPPNAASPNVDITNRFSDAGKGSQGISTFASSSSSNINGKETHHREAGTTVNDNGKITTYHVKD